MERIHRGAHGGHYQSTDDANQRRQNHQARLVGPNKGPEPPWRLQIAGLGDHFAVSIRGSVDRPLCLAAFKPPYAVFVPVLVAPSQSASSEPSRADKLRQLFTIPSRCM